MVVIFERISLEILGKNRLFSIYERNTNSSWYGKSNSSFPSVWKSYNCEKYLASRRTRKLKFCILLITGARMRTVGSADNFTDVSRGVSTPAFSLTRLLHAIMRLRDRQLNSHTNQYEKIVHLSLAIIHFLLPERLFDHTSTHRYLHAYTHHFIFLFKSIY